MGKFNSGRGSNEDSEDQREFAGRIFKLIQSGDASAIEQIDTYVTDGYDLNAPAVRSDSKTFYDPTLLMGACAYGREEVVTHLIGKGANLKKQNTDGLDAYVHAAKNGHVHILQILEQHGCSFRDANSKDGTIAPSLFWAARYGQFAVVEYLEKQGADIHSRDSCGYGLLHQAAESGDLGLIKYLLDKKFDPNAVGEGIRDMTPLMNAARMSDSPEAVQMLIDAGGKVDQTDAFGRSALSWAPLGEEGEAIREVLLKAGANPQKADETGLLAFDTLAQDLANDQPGRSVKFLASELLRNRFDPRRQIPKGPQKKKRG